MQLNKNRRVLTTDATLCIKCSYRELVCMNFFLVVVVVVVVVVFYCPGLKRFRTGSFRFDS